MNYSEYEKALGERLHNIEWLELLRDRLNSKEFKDAASYVARRRNVTNVYPSKEDLFNTFKLKPKDIKVVILGQDPYPNHNANGLAFSSIHIPMPKSLQIILQEVSNQYPTSFNDSLSGDLTYWLEQGVFLLNSVLTVENKPESHYMIGWEYFTISVLKAINKVNDNVVFLLWGSYAHRFSKYINKDKNLVIESEHPVANSYQGKNWNSNECFINANKYLIKNNKEPIEW